MPLDGQQRPGGVVVLDGFDDAVVGPPDRGEPGGQIPHGLVVNRVDHEVVAPDDLGDPAARRQPDMLVPVVDERSGGTVGRPDLGGDVLDEGSSEGDVEQLEAAADCERWDAAAGGLVGKLDLELVSVSTHVVQRVDGDTAVAVGFDVAPAGEDESVDPIEHGGDGLSRDGTKQDGDAAGSHHGVEVGAFQGVGV